MKEKERIRKEYFIGGSEDLHSIFTMELNVTYRNGYQEFTASFNEGDLVNIDEKNELLKLCDKMKDFEDIEKVINERIVL